LIHHKLQRALCQSGWLVSYVGWWTVQQRRNDDMRALNTHLGSVTRRESIRMRATIPLTAMPAADAHYQ
jgi:hypothetical protein